MIKSPFLSSSLPLHHIFLPFLPFPNCSKINIFPPEKEMIFEKANYWYIFSALLITSKLTWDDDLLPCQMEVKIGDACLLFSLIAHACQKISFLATVLLTSGHTQNFFVLPSLQYFPPKLNRDEERRKMWFLLQPFRFPYHGRLVSFFPFSHKIYS